MNYLNYYSNFREYFQSTRLTDLRYLSTVNTMIDIPNFEWNELEINPKELLTRVHEMLISPKRGEVTYS